MRLVKFFLLLLMWAEPAHANFFSVKPDIGKMMPPQKNREEAYRYGFNGQMKDNEIAGVGNHTSALYWEYDTRTGRRANEDPVPRTGISNYATFGANPIFNVDPNGDYFFGLVGSSSEQRHAAKAYAKEHNGEVVGIGKRSIHVDYTKGYSWSENKLDNGGWTADKGSQYFNKDDGSLSDPNGTATAHNPGMLEKWGDSKNILARASYGLADGFYVTGQNLGIRQLLGDGNAYHLGGGSTTPDENVEAFVTAGTSVVPAAEASYAMGPFKQWLRIGESYSVSGGFKTFGIRWGASPARNGAYIKQIPSTSLQDFNQYMRSLKLPGKSWRVSDPGHLHLWEK